MSDRGCCVIDWRAFGLAASRGGTGCAAVPIVIVMQACVHEHVAAAKVCGPCLSEFVSYGDAEDWTCGPCLEAGHQCSAPLRVTDLAYLDPPARERVDAVLGALVDERLRALPGGDTP